MARYSHDDIPSTAPTAGLFDGVKEAARQARDFACQLRSEHPAVATGGTLVGSPAQQWIDTVWDNMCRKSPTPTAPQPTKPYSGGQCLTQYVVQFSDKIKDLSSGVVYTRTGSATVNGKLGGLKTVYPGGDPTLGRGIGIVTQSGANVVALAFGTNDFPQVDFSITSVTRVDGQPDNCGDPQPEYPPDFNPPTPPDFTKPYQPPFSGAPNRNWNITIPLVYVDAQANIAINNKFDIKVDVGGVNIKFDLGGVDVNIDNKGGDGTPGSGTGSGTDLGDLPDKVDQAKNAANDAKNAANDAKNSSDRRNKNDPLDPKNDPNQQDKSQKNEDDPKQEDAVNRLLAVEVEITSRPANARQQDGDGAPDVFYCGWFEFRTKGTPHPRQPIHFLRNHFDAPPGADGYAYTVYNGFRAKATVITAKATS